MQGCYARQLQRGERGAGRSPDPGEIRQTKSAPKSGPAEARSEFGRKRPRKGAHSKQNALRNDCEAALRIMRRAHSQLLR